MPPKQKPGHSKQDYETPWSLIDAVEHRFGEALHWDLAACSDTCKVRKRLGNAYYGPDHSHLPYRDAFANCWFTHRRLLWLNPPFGDIDPWAEKCHQEMLLGARIMFLTPASVGARWFERHVWSKAYIIYLTPRLTFGTEKTPYPKDCCLSYFCHGIHGSEIWDWKRFLNGSKTPLEASKSASNLSTGTKRLVKLQNAL